MEKLAFNTGTEEIKKAAREDKWKELDMSVTSLPRTVAGAHVRERGRLCLLHLGVVHHNRIKSLELMKSQCPHHARLGGVHFRLALVCCCGLNPQLECIWGVHKVNFPGLFHVKTDQVVYSETAMRLESTHVNWGELGNFPQKHFADSN